MKNTFNLDLLGISPKKLFRNLCTAQLYAQALRYDAGAVISDKGALVLMSGEKTGRSPYDKRIVQNKDTEDDIWWGDINIPMDERTFYINRHIFFIKFRE